MGYYVSGNGYITIEHSKVDDAYKALCDLNQQDHLKTGGTWGGDGVTGDKPRPEGKHYHPARWFSWMDADYPSKCKDLIEVLEMVGFQIDVTETTNTDTTYRIIYDNKMGQEELFLRTLAPFLSEGDIEWSGEDGAMWKDVFSNGEMVTKKGYVVYR